MNCLDFRRAAQAQPRALPPEARDHAATCPACAAVLDRERALDDRLGDTLRVPAPDGLADRVLVAHGLRRRFMPLRWAMAAGVVLAGGLAWMVPPVVAGQRLAREAIAHVDAEPQSFHIRNPHGHAELVAMLAEQGLKLAADVGPVTYSQLCPMSDGKAHHLVLDTPEGPVTLLLMPRDEIQRRKATAGDRGQFAIAMPAPRGSLAIVAATEARAMAFSHMIVPA